MLSFANDQLDECLARVWTAESLLLEDGPWVGQKMLLGMVYLIAGPMSTRDASCHFLANWDMPAAGSVISDVYTFMHVQVQTMLNACLFVLRYVLISLSAREMFRADLLHMVLGSVW